MGTAEEPGGLPSTPAWRVAMVITTLLACAYIAATLSPRFRFIFDEWVADPDQRQAVWQYWRYNINGAMPPGDLLTDYAFVMHAPFFWWLMMAGLSLFFEPIHSAMILNVAAYLGTCVAAWWVLRAYANHIVSLVGGMLIAHSLSFHLVTAGGYARTFGPLLVLLFLGTFIRKKHYWTLAVLILQAGLYPSVVISCGMTYGAWCIFAPPYPDWRRRIRRTVEVSLTGVGVIGFGLYQDLISPDWWGSVVWLSEALEMPSWGRGGRVNEAPLRDPWFLLRANLERPFASTGGPSISEAAIRWSNSTRHLPFLILFLVPSIYLAVRRVRVPLHPFLLMAFAVVAYFLARLLAFKLYLPYRSLTHTFPYILYVMLPLLTYAALRHLWPKRHALHTTLSVLVVLVPITLFAGLGLGDGPRRTYSDGYKHQRHLFNFVRKTPLDAKFAGTFGATDQIPLFAYHQVYVNRVLAHPFRKGFYAEVERRIDLSYRAVWAHDPCEIVSFVTKEKIDYLAYDQTSFDRRDRGVFKPLRGPLFRFHEENKAKGFYLEEPPEEIVAFRHKRWPVVDAKKLVEREGPGCAAP